MYHLFFLNSILYLLLLYYISWFKIDLYNKYDYVNTISFCYIIIKLYGIYILFIKIKILPFET